MLPILKSSIFIRRLLFSVAIFPGLIILVRANIQDWHQGWFRFFPNPNHYFYYQESSHYPITDHDLRQAIQPFAPGEVVGINMINRAILMDHLISGETLLSEEMIQWLNNGSDVIRVDQSTGDQLLTTRAPWSDFNFCLIRHHGKTQLWLFACTQNGQRWIPIQSIGHLCFQDEWIYPVEPTTYTINKHTPFLHSKPEIIHGYFSDNELGHLYEIYSKTWQAKQDYFLIYLFKKEELQLVGSKLESDGQGGVNELFESQSATQDADGNWIILTPPAKK